MSHRMLKARCVSETDIPTVCLFPQNANELFFMFPKATYPLTHEQLRESIAKRMDSTVVELNGQVVGFANLYRWEFEGKCSIGNFVISPDARQRGVGKFLVQHMVEQAKSRHHARDVTISCFHQNIGALLLYTKCGFEPYEIEPRVDPYGNPAALIHMRLQGDRLNKPKPC